MHMVLRSWIGQRRKLVSSNNVVYDRTSMLIHRSRGGERIGDHEVAERDTQGDLKCGQEYGKATARSYQLTMDFKSMRVERLYSSSILI